MKALLSQVEMSFIQAREEGVENLTLYKETFDKLAMINRRDIDYDAVVAKGLKFATYGNIRSNTKVDATINIAQRFLSSKWASTEGRKKIVEKAVNTGSQRFAVSKDVYQKGVKKIIEYKQRLNAIDVLENEVAADLAEKWVPPSRLVFEAVEMAKSWGLADNVVDESLDYVEKNASSLNDLDDMRDALYHFFETKVNDV